MDLELSLSLDRGDYLFSESVVARLELKYRGTAPREMPAMDLNDQVVGFTLLGEAGEELGRYDHRDFQRRVGASRVFEDRVSLHEFRPGETDLLLQDLWLLREPLPAGSYSLVGHYRWQDLDIRSAPVEFEIRPSHPGRLAFGWDADEGGPYHILLAWTDRDGATDVLMESCSFGSGPRGRDHTTRAGAVGAVDELAVTRDLAGTAEMRGTVLWKEGSTLHWQSVDPGESFPVFETEIPLRDCSIVPSPYREGANSTVVLLLGGGELLALALHGDGTTTEIVRRPAGAATHHLLLHTVDHGSFHLSVQRKPDGGGQLVAQGLGRKDTPRVLWEGTRPGSHLVGVIDESGRPSALLGIHDASGDKLYTQRFSGAKLEQAATGPAFELPRGSIPQLALGAEGSVHLLARNEHGVWMHGAEDSGMEALESLAKLAGEPQLIVGRGGKGFVLVASDAMGVQLISLGPAPVPGVVAPGHGKGG